MGPASGRLPTEGLNGQAAHAGISTISSLMGGGTGSPCLLRLARCPVIALMLARASARVLPCEMQPGRAGHSATSTPSSSGSITPRLEHPRSFREGGLKDGVRFVPGHLAMPKGNFVAQRLQSSGHVLFQRRVGEVRVLGGEGEESPERNEPIHRPAMGRERLSRGTFEEVLSLSSIW